MKRGSEKFIDILFFIGIFISFVDIFTLAGRMDEEDGSITITAIIHYLPPIFFIASGFLSMIFERKNYLNKYYKIYLFLLGYMLILNVVDYPESFSIGILFSSKGLITWLLTASIFVANPRRLTLLEKYLPWLMFFICGYLLFNIAKFSVGFSRTDALQSLLYAGINLYWIVSYFFINNRLKAQKPIAVNLYFGIMLIAMLLTMTRSYILLSLIVIFIATLNTGVKKLINPLNLLVVLSSILIILMFLGNSDSVINYSIQSTLERSSTSDDVRSTQLTEFIDQMSFLDVLVGTGPDSTWNWSSKADPYAYIDNQILLLAWFGGLFSLIMFLRLTVWPGIKLLLSRRKIPTAWLSLIWFLCMGGLAIYTTFSNNLYYYLFCFYAGINIYYLKNPNVKELFV